MIEPNTINSFTRVGGGETYVWVEIDGIPYNVQEYIGEYTLNIEAKLVDYINVPVDNQITVPVEIISSCITYSLKPTLFFEFVPLIEVKSNGD